MDGQRRQRRRQLLLLLPPRLLLQNLGLVKEHLHQRALQSLAFQTRRAQHTACSTPEMSFDDDDSIDSAFAYPCDDDTPSAGFDADPESPLHVPVPSAAASADSSFAVRPGNWRRKLKQEAMDSKVRGNGKDMGSDITFDMPHNAPDIVLALVTMNVTMLFGSSLQSRLRGLWDDTHFMVEFYIVADGESPLGISVASNSTAEFHTAPKTYKDAGSRSVSNCFQEGAMSAIVLRSLQSGFRAWHTTFFHTAERCRDAQAAPHQEALQILKDALERPCRISATDALTGVITTCGDDFLSISDNELNDGSMDYHVRITVHSGCITAIDFDGHANPRHQRFLDAARLRLGVRQAPLPISRSTAAAIVELIMAPLVHRDADATPNLFSYLAAHVALSMKNCLASVNSHTGAELSRPSVMPFVPLSDLSLYAIDNGMCGLALQDALCSIPPDVLTIIFKSAVVATDKNLQKSGSSATFDLCQPWPSFLLKQIVRNEDRTGIIGDATRRADTDSKGLKGGVGVAGTSQAALHAGLGIENKKVDEWRNSLVSALHALRDPGLIDMMLGARQGSPLLEQRETILQMFLSLSAAHSGQEASMIAKICGYVLRTLPYLPVPVFDNVLWFGNGTPWEDGLADDVGFPLSIAPYSRARVQWCSFLTPFVVCHP